MGALRVPRRLFSGFIFAVLFAASFSPCATSERSATVVGSAECLDCAIKTDLAFLGLHVAVKCKAGGNGKLYETKGLGELDKNGEFNVQIPNELLGDDGELKKECFAQLIHTASGSPCPDSKINGVLNPSKLVLDSEKDGVHTFISAAGKKLPFSSACTSAFFWPPHSKGHPLHKFHFFHHPFHKKPLPPPIPIYKPPVPEYKPPPVPVYKPPVSVSKPPPVPEYKPPPVPVYKPPVPIYKPPVPVYKPPPVPVYKPPVPEYKPPPVPVYKPPVPVSKPPPVPIYKPPVPIYKPPVPVYKPPLVPIYKPPVVKKPCPPPVPVYKKPLPPPVPVYKEPIPPPVPYYKPPVIPPIHKKPFPHIHHKFPPIHKKPCPPFPHLPPKIGFPPSHGWPPIPHFPPAKA